MKSRNNEISLSRMADFSSIDISIIIAAQLRYTNLFIIRHYIDILSSKFVLLFSRLPSQIQLVWSCFQHSSRSNSKLNVSYIYNTSRTKSSISKLHPIWGIPSILTVFLSSYMQCEFVCVCSTNSCWKSMGKWFTRNVQRKTRDNGHTATTKSDLFNLFIIAFCLFINGFGFHMHIQQGAMPFNVPHSILSDHSKTVERYFIQNRSGKQERKQ